VDPYLRNQVDHLLTGDDMQTAVASKVPVHEYLMSVLRANPDDVTNHPDRFTPLAYATRTASK
jgi:hypothetical protein